MQSFIAALRDIPDAKKDLYDETCGKFRYTTPDHLREQWKNRRRHPLVFTSKDDDLDRKRDIPWANAPIPKKWFPLQSTDTKEFCIGNWVIFVNVENAVPKYAYSIGFIKYHPTKKNAEERGRKHFSLCRQLRQKTENYIYLCSGMFCYVNKKVFINTNSGSMAMAKIVVHHVDDLEMPTDEQVREFSSPKISNFLHKVLSSQLAFK